VVLLLRPGGRKPRSPASYRVRGPGGGELGFRYHLISLADCDPARMKRRLPPAGWPLLVAMRGGRDPGSVRALAAELGEHPGLTPERRGTTLHLLFLVTAAMLGGEAARRLFVMESIIQSPGVQELYRLLREEGRVAEARSALVRVLARRGFEPSAELCDRIAAEDDVERLEAWHDAAVTAASLEDVFE
jgi:hypothetical protein